MITVLCELSPPFRADIRADSNRDGVVDIHGQSDVQDKHEWSNTAGAVFLANIGDTNRRCSKLALQGKALSNEELEACNDASGDIQRAPQYMAAMRTVPIPGVSNSAVGTVSISNRRLRKNVRIFRRDGVEWVFTSNDHRFTADELKVGLELGIDARDTRRPGVWDGRVTVHFNVTDGWRKSTDSVNLRVAPVLTHHHSQPVKEIFTTAGNKSVNPFQAKFVSNLRGLLRAANLNYPLFEFSHSDDLWTQDFFEPAYTSMPGLNGSTVLQIMIRSSQDERTAGRQVFEHLRKSGRGAVQYLHGPQHETNSMGNLETIPPYELKGKKYPAGRIVIGSHGTSRPFILEYMQAQEVQDPIVLDTGWLAVGHVDEFIQFLPANNTRGWVMLVADPFSGYGLLRRAQASGYGDVLAFSRQNDTEGSPATLFGYGGGIVGVPKYTINDVLAQRDLLAANANFSDSIRANIEIVKEATGITNEDIFHVPTFFRITRKFPPGTETLHLGIDGSSDHVDGVYPAGSLYPSAINGVVLSDSKYLAPRPWGPVIHGKDIIAEAISDVYRRVGFDVLFIDDWSSHHFWGGEIHCATNTIRDGSKPWW